ncbi:hypothetical protein KVR01_013272 [Diaporthe batatas]|uniref:uncharacterized protein n=1 Tax=Diaporthe batatas TaxID=748121 RepID=UPI001D05736E|nr:uncharacterized protein KVR01_013272 [Diaporthe batatas]KAG8156859.1 hypothetical protein KVR01_013272 [Diaporthe batatas]
MRRDSESLQPGGNRPQSSLRLPSDDEHQASVSRTTSQHQNDGLKAIPRSLSFAWWSFAADAISILVTIPFIVLGIFLARAKGGIVEKHALHSFENGIRLAATALPFVFAAIFGRLTAQVARWKLERGGSLPSIEQWLGSRTLFSAFLTQVNMGGMNVIGVSMMVAWALSPLGAQSILRILGTGSREITTNGSVTYFDTSTPSTFTALKGTSNTVLRNDVPAMIDSMYAASLMSADSIKSSGQDLWGNIKIPYLFSHFERAPGDEWVNVPNDGSVKFSSLVGIPFAANFKPGLRHRSNFRIESSHIQLQCSEFVPSKLDDNGHIDTSYVNSSLGGTWDLDGAWQNACIATSDPPDNGTFQGFTWSGDDDAVQLSWRLAMDTFIDPSWLSRLCHSIYESEEGQHFSQFSPATFANEHQIATSRARLQLLAWRGLLGTSESDPRATTCGVSQSWVESRVDCEWSTSSPCVVTAQRPSRKQHASSNITHLSFPSVFTGLTSHLPRASGLRYSAGFLDASTIYLANTSTSFMLGREGHEATFDNLTDSDISGRLGRLINTYLMISQAYDPISRGSLREGEVQDLAGSAINNITTTMWIVKVEDIYTVNNAWLAAYLVTAVAMLIGSIVGAVFCHSSITPEILGFASAAIRDSKHVDLAPGFGALGGLEMTKAFEEIEFRYGVVNKSDSGQEVLGVSWKVSAQRVKKRVPYV